MPGKKRVSHICGCGCGELVPSRFDAKTGQNKGQGHPSTTGKYYVPGHGRKIAGQHSAERIRAHGHPQAVPIGSTFIDGGYIREKTANQVWPLQHRLIKGVTDPKIHVHHDNEDTADNRLENLIALSPAEHNRIHAQRRCPGWATKYPCCAACGTTDREHHAAGLCMRCYMRRRLGCQPRIRRSPSSHPAAPTT